VLETERRRKEEKIQKEKDLAGAAKTLRSLGTPDCPVVHRTVSGAPGWRLSTSRSREFIGSVRLKFTGLSGEPTVGRANSRPRNPRVTRGRANCLMGAPDSVRCANGSKSAMVDCADLGRRSAPDSEQWMSGGAPDCPVRHLTEGKNCLPGLLPTAPRPLVPIKGTPRRLKQVHKRNQ
jgi:hypothetical protein